MRKVRICFHQPEDIAEFVEIMNHCEYDVDLQSGKNIIDAKSLLGVMTLSKEAEIELIIHGEDCEELLNKIQHYVMNSALA